MNDDIFTYERAPFVERLARLAGKVQRFQAVAGGGNSKPDIPEEHALAMALSYGTRQVFDGSDYVCDSSDVGPDIALAIYAGYPIRRGRVVAELTHAMLIGIPRARKYPHQLPMIAAVAYMMVVTPWAELSFPRGVKTGDMERLASFGTAMLWEAAMNTARRAERAFYRDDGGGLSRG